MPIVRKKDKKGNYYQYGESGKKYYYTPGDQESRKRAKKKSCNQEIAININKK